MGRRKNARIGDRVGGRRLGAVEESHRAKRASRVDTREHGQPVSFPAAEQVVLEKLFLSDSESSQTAR